MPQKRSPLTFHSQPSCGVRYYDRIFPVNLMCRWLSYGTQHDEVASQNLLHRREFSFTTGDDVYIRYLSYDNAAAFKKVRRAIRRGRID